MPPAELARSETDESAPAAQRRRRSRAEEPLEVGGVAVQVGEARHLQLPLTEVPIRLTVPMHVSVIRGRRAGPRLFVSAGVHGDELNGIEIARPRELWHRSPRISPGISSASPSSTCRAFSPLTVPALGSDLNRFFPGSTNGKPAARLAPARHARSGVPLRITDRPPHGGRGSANVPHVVPTWTTPEVRHIAKAFGTTIIVPKVGHRSSLRRVATRSGVATIVLEAGRDRQVPAAGGETSASRAYATSSNPRRMPRGRPLDTRFR